jgi:DNA-directed RNA polymerase specialized sigma24 family protein
MKDFRTNTDWVSNKDSEDIVYTFADGTQTEVTLADFLKDCRTAEEIERKTDEFNRLKKLSDELLRTESLGDADNDRNTLPIFEWSEKLSTKTLEEDLLDEIEKGERVFYEERISMLKEKLPLLLDKLTSTQRRRLQMYRIDGMTLRDIAKVEGVSFQAIEQSISYIEKKIKKILAKG